MQWTPTAEAGCVYRTKVVIRALPSPLFDIVLRAPTSVKHSKLSFGSSDPQNHCILQSLTYESHAILQVKDRLRNKRQALFTLCSVFFRQPEAKINGAQQEERQQHQLDELDAGAQAALRAVEEEARSDAHESLLKTQALAKETLSNTEEMQARVEEIM